MIESVLLRILYLTEAGIVVTQILNRSAISSVLFTMTFVFTFLLWLFVSKERLSENDLLMLLVISISVINVSLNAFMEEADLSFGYLKKLIMFITSLLYLQAMSRLKIDEKTERFISVVITGLAVFILFIYMIRGRSLYELNGRITDYLTFHFTNPNLTALFLSCIAYFLVCKWIKSRKSVGKWFYLILFTAMFYLTYRTRSRNALIVLIVFVLLSLKLSFSKKIHFQIHRKSAAFITFFPILFVIGYLFFSNNDVLRSWLSFLISEGKQLNSRMTIWKPAVEHYYQSPLIGSYYEISGGTGASQLHNTHLDILTSYGSFVFIGVCILLYRWLWNKNREYSKEAFIYLLSFCCVLFLGMGEAAMFSGGLGIYILGGLYLLLAQKDVDGTEKAVDENRISE